MLASKTVFTDHALLRLNARTSLSADEVAEIIDRNQVVNIGMEFKNNRESKLFFSLKDNKFFVAVRDYLSGSVITVLTLEYWHNLAKKHLHEDVIVSKKELVEAILCVDPENPVKDHPPILLKKIIRFIAIVDDIKSDEVPSKYVRINGGKMPINIFESDQPEIIANMIISNLSTRLEAKGLPFESVLSVVWGYGNGYEEPMKSFEITKDEDFIFLAECIKRDIEQRNAQFEKYEDFCEVINRHNKQANYQMSA